MRAKELVEVDSLQLHMAACDQQTLELSTARVSSLMQHDLQYHLAALHACALAQTSWQSPKTSKLCQKQQQTWPFTLSDIVLMMMVLVTGQDDGLESYGGSAGAHQ